MSLYNRALDVVFTLFPSRQPKTTKLNRVDAPPHLLEYHDSSVGPRSPPSQTLFLPLRTRIEISPLSTLGMAQTHAYYEEIDSIPASAANQTSPFHSACWWIIHPVTCVQVLDLSTRVLVYLKVWIEETVPNELFVRKSGTIMGFKGVREETLGNVMSELKKRKDRGDLESEEGYVGGWQAVGRDGEEMAKEVTDEDDNDRCDELHVRKQKKANRLSRNSGAQLEEAAAAGRNAAEEAKVKNEYEYVV